jgi:hypothetical protein
MVGSFFCVCNQYTLSYEISQMLFSLQIAEEWGIIVLSDRKEESSK